MKLWRSLLSAILLMQLPLTALAQQFLVRNFGTQDGLPHANVYRIFQDRRGFLWFSTDYGLSVYNGQNFNTTFPDKDGLLHHAVMSVFEDAAGKKYVNGYRNGLMVITDTAVLRYHFSSGAYPAFSMYTATDGQKIWVIGKPWLYYIIDSCIRRCLARDAGGHEVEFVKLVTTDTGLLATSDHGIYLLHDTVATPLFQTIEDGPTIDVARTGDGTYWIGALHSISSIKNGRLNARYRLNARQLVKAVMADSHGDLWISLDGEGVLRIHNGKLEDITGMLVTNKTIVNDMLEDREGNIWLATYGAGVYRISATGVVAYQGNSSTPNIFCRALCSDGRTILIGSVGKVLQWQGDAIVPAALPGMQLNMFVYFIRSLGNNLYIGTSKGLLVKNKNTGRAKLYKATRAYAALSMCAGADGHVWVGDYRHLYSLANDTLTEDSLANPYMGRHNAMLCTHNGERWIGTDSGVYVCPADGKAKPLLYHGANVNDMLEDAQHRVWVASDNGLTCYSNGTFRTFSKTEGLSSVKCNALVTDSSNRLWVGTLNGLCYVDLITMAAARYTRELITDDILSLALHQGRLFVGTVNRLASVDLSDVASKAIIPPLYITDVRTSARQYHNPAAIHLRPDENHLVINYIALHFSAPQTVQYRYKIAELDDAWSYTRSNTVEFPAMPSGSYHFIISARANDGPWSKALMLPIVIDTPLWKNWWFIGALAVTAGTAIALLARRRLLARQAKQRHRLLLYNKMIYLKQQALSALINPHFMFNCMNSIQYYLDNNENDKANVYLADFAHLLRLTLEDAQKVYISLESEIARIRLYLSLEQLRFGDSLEYSITADPALDQQHVFLPNMVVQPYVENAIWHGIIPLEGAGRIDITFRRLTGDEISITIRDNGVGIDTEKAAVPGNEGHYGMKLTEERLALLGKLTRHKYQVRYEHLRHADGGSAGTLVELVVTTQPADVPLALFNEDDLIAPLPHS